MKNIKNYLEFPIENIEKLRKFFKNLENFPENLENLVENLKKFKKI